ncbi:helix-turn-helix domain-containing protein [Bradyrhizobium sp. Ce-3]|uniref:winged helix-turn-helix transcriptional regulator n=1 Tax=Bradyrhizobium sp. Ce-3 TaxID=2913970 RepID=UPI001FC83A7B|nr:helix-turn-helix domain-containing protein [Bradyrhizobium sp. Ce-3]GKQ53117.1 transcriptional regulator [Bradyrhizobium sp. Ce-3]
MENNTSDACDGSECENCPSDPSLLIDFKHAIDALGGKWKLEILFTLMNGGVRFGALRRALVPITQHMLTAQLRELERDGLVARKVLAERPLQVEYELTDSAWGLTPAFRELLAWSKAFGPRRHAEASASTLEAGLA